MTDNLQVENPEYNEFARAVFSYDLVPRCTVPIAGSKDGMSYLNRTGVLFRVADLNFLITAKHGTHKDNLIVDIMDAGFRLFIPPESPQGPMLAFGIKDLWTSTSKGTDYAVFELDEDTTEVLESCGLEFAGIRDVAPMHATGSIASAYLIAGFPIELQDRDELGRKRFEYFHLLTGRWDPHFGNATELPSDFQYSPKDHLLLMLEEELVHTTGLRKSAPSPSGLSGCGVWHARDWASMALWTPGQIRLVGIQSSWNRSHRCLKVGCIDECFGDDTEAVPGNSQIVLSHRVLRAIMTAEEMWGGKQFHGFAERVFDHDPVYFCTVPIGLTDAKGEDSKTWLDRTGILLRVAGTPFLITARHGSSQDNLICDYFDAGFRAFIAPLQYPRPDEPYVEIRWRQLWIADHKECDFAVFELQPEAADAMEKQGQRFIGMDSVRKRDEIGQGRVGYLVSGYPKAIEKSEGGAKSRWEYYPWLSYQWNPHFGDPANLPLAYDPEVHLLIAYDKAAMHTSGDRGTSPNPTGMSGCGVWYVKDFDSLVLWNEEQIKLVGMQSGWFSQNRVLKTIWIDHALAMIWFRYPDTRDPMRLHGYEFCIR